MRRVEGGALDERLPRFAVAEFDVIGQSMNHLTTTLAAAEASRQSLAARLHKVQEVERANLARDLHDDMGWQLTAMQANIAWLEKTRQRAKHAGTQRAARLLQQVATRCGAYFG